MKMTKSGATIAAAAATLFLAGTTLSTTTAYAQDGKCVGANACKGQGFSAASEKQCAAMGAKFVKG